MLNKKIIKSIVNSFLDTGSGFGFKNWYYITAGIKLFKNGAIEQVYFNINCFFILVNKVFLKKYLLEIKIRTILVSINIKNIGFNKYFTAEYIILLIYLPGEFKKESVNTFFKRKAYIVEDLKIKIFLGVNIMGPKGINIFIFKKKAYINSCKVEISIVIKFYFF